jgi:hypothetical protein
MPIFLSQSDQPSMFTGRHYMFVPIETPSIPPRQRFGGLIILSGVATISFATPSGGTLPAPGRRDRVILDLDEDLRRAILSAPYTLPSPLQQFGGFSIEQHVAFATVNGRHVGLNPAEMSVYAIDRTAVDAFWSSHGGATIQIDVTVFGKLSNIFGLGYHLSLYGHLVVSDSGVVGGAASTAQADAPADSLDK